MSDGSRTPAVTIVTVTYNSAQFIDEWTASLKQIDYLSWRLIAVDSASNDDTVDRLARALPEAEIVRGSENLGFARGNNVGVQRALAGACDYVLFMNNDTTATGDFLTKLVAAVDERTVVIPKILWSFDHRIISTHAGGFDWDLGLFRETYHGKPDGPATNVPRELETASFCCALVPRRLLEEAGPFEEAFFMYYEETDLLKRARALGYRIRYVPDAIIYHRESGSSGGGWMTPFKLYYATRNRLYLVRKHRRSRLRYAWFTAYFWATRLPQIARYVLARDRRRLKAMVLGVTDYYRGRMGRTREVADFR